MPADPQNTTTGVLLMAYGTPQTAAEVEPYFTHIRGGKTPSPDAIAGLTRRYAAVGGKTPLLEITEQVRTALERQLREHAGLDVRVYAGMKHWHPFIADVMRQMATDGIRDLVAVALAPHFSRISIGGYQRAVESADELLGHPFQVQFVESWHLQPEFIAMTAANIRRALARMPDDLRDRTVVVFSAHSLPERIREWDDPYERQLLESSAAVADAAGVRGWRFAWQSAGHTGEPWLGPDIVDYLPTLRDDGVTAVLSVPIGFVSEHLEILYDLDIEARQAAAGLGMRFERTELPNASPAFIETLEAVVLGALRPIGQSR